MTYKSIIQNIVPYVGAALVGLYHTLNEPVYYGGKTAWNVDTNIDVNNADINTTSINVAGVGSANINILDVSSFQSSYQVTDGVLSGITSTNRLNLQYDPNIALTYVITGYTTTAIGNVGVGTYIIPALVSIGETGISVGDRFIDGVFDIPITGIITQVGAGIYVSSGFSTVAPFDVGIGTNFIPAFTEGIKEGDQFINDDTLITITGVGTTSIYLLSNFTTISPTNISIGSNFFFLGITTESFLQNIKVGDQIINDGNGIDITEIGESSIYIVSDFTSAVTVDAGIGTNIVALSGVGLLKPKDQLITDAGDVIIDSVRETSITLKTPISVNLNAGTNVSFREYLPQVFLASTITAGISTENILVFNKRIPLISLESNTVSNILEGDILSFNEFIPPRFKLSGFTTTATSFAGIGSTVIPVVVSIGETTYIQEGDQLINSGTNINIIGIGSTTIAGLGLTSVITLDSGLISGISTGNTLIFRERIPLISLASTISSPISIGDTLRFKKPDWSPTPWASGEGGTMIDIDVSENMVIVGGIATVPIWNFNNFVKRSSRMATVSVVGISTRIVAGAGASDASYIPGDVSAGSLFKINGNFQYYRNGIIKSILWDTGSAPDFINSQMSLITFRLVTDNLGELYILGSKDGQFS
jgi:hypothetical protein